MEQLPVIQTFFNKPVRFFKTEFEVELGCRNNTPAPQKITLKTWGVPLPDFCKAIDYAEDAVRRIIQNNKEVFEGFYRREHILDMAGVQHRETILMAYEMCQLVAAKLQTTRLKDPDIRALVVNFQQWVIIVFNLINTKKLLPCYWKPTKAVLDEYERVLLLPMGPETSVEVKALAERHGKSLQQVYRRLQKVRGSNALTSRGKPKKSPSFKGTHKMPEEAQKIMDTANANPGLTNREIWEQSGTAYSYGYANVILRQFKH